VIIALTGPSKSGKDQAAAYLCEAWRHRAARGAQTTTDLERAHDSAVTMALADPLRWAADALGIPANVTREDKDVPQPFLGGRTGRDVLLALGETVRAACGDDYLARLGAQRARDLESGSRLVVVTDVRRDVEADTLVLGRARLLFVDRGVDSRQDALYGPESARMETIAHPLRNRGGLAELRITCDAVVESLWKEQ